MKNRAEKRKEARLSGRCRNDGTPQFITLTTKEERNAFKVLRHNKKLMKITKRLAKNKVVYSKGMVKEAQKVMKNPKKFSDHDNKMAKRVIERFENYNLFCLEDFHSKLIMTGKAI